MGDHVERHGLRIGVELADFVETEAVTGAGISADTVWATLADLVATHGPRIADLLDERTRLQSAIDAWHREHPGPTTDIDAYRAMLIDIGYLQPVDDDTHVDTAGVDDEIAHIAGPQLVVPVTNARYAINAVNARWGSLYDALYGTDALGDSPPSGPYDPVRGARVITQARKILDEVAPLDGASHTTSTAYRIVDGTLQVTLDDGRTVGPADTVTTVGWAGPVSTPSRVVLRHHGLHAIIEIDPTHSVGAVDAAGVADVILEAAVSTIVDCEDSVACVDAADKAAAYRNWFGLQRGTLTCDVTKGTTTFTRQLADDITVDTVNGAITLPGRSMMLVRNVGHLMTTPAVLDTNGAEVSEGIVDALVTVLCAHPATSFNSRHGSIYVVKPKMHGPDEVAGFDAILTDIEDALGLPRYTVKVGIMDEERRTTLNLAACIRAARHRVAFINTGFLDRTGDEIHTSMLAGPMVRKADMKSEAWISAYEDNNVDVGLACGLIGRAQIGKGMWAAPDLMADMLATKINHPLAGASCAWVPSPTAATLHAIHYHRVDVAERQGMISDDPARGHSRLDELLAIPVEDNPAWTEAAVQAELDNNAQGILGYVVRWVDQGVGCSKVPDINDIGLMEDRATCRISSQHMANWLAHGIVDETQVRETFTKMAAVVDQQNADDEEYTPLTSDSTALKAALDLVLSGTEQPSGYTEPILHARRLEVKATS